MANTKPSNPNVGLSFLLWWILANIVGLRALSAPFSAGQYILMGLAMLSDGGKIGFIFYIFTAIILMVIGAIVGAWLGLFQWFVLRRQISRIGKWILASSLGTSVGGSLGWLVYILVSNSPISHRLPDVLSSILLADLASWITLSLSIGVAQWLILRKSVARSGWWIATLFICSPLFITLSLSSMPSIEIYVLLRIIPLLSQVIDENLLKNSVWVLQISGLILPLLALAGISLITGIVLRWLLRFHKKETK